MRLANNLHFYTGNHELSTPKYVRCPLESGFELATASMAHIMQQIEDRGTALSIIILAAYLSLLLSCQCYNVTRQLFLGFWAEIWSSLTVRLLHHPSNLPPKPCHIFGPVVYHVVDRVSKNPVGYCDML
jgi:hypothetical protein